MTLREADEAAQKRLPVIHQGIEYLRITETGYRYSEKAQAHRLRATAQVRPQRNLPPSPDAAF